MLENIVLDIARRSFVAKSCGVSRGSAGVVPAT